MSINIADLPEKYQMQALRKYREQMAARKSRTKAWEAVAPGFAQKAPTHEPKYHNKPTERLVDSGKVIHFASQKEAARYDQLVKCVQSGQIKDLRLQAEYTLQEAYTDQHGNRIRAIRYVADFTYQKKILDGGQERWQLVVEDVKSRPTRTKSYAIKRKLLKERFGIDIAEV